MINNWNQILSYCLGLCACFGTVKILKLLRFNRKISYLGSTLKYGAKDLIAFSFVLAFIWLAFVQLMFLVFSINIQGYSTFIKAMETSFQVVLGKFNVSVYTVANPVLGPMIFAAYNIILVFVSINMFISIIVDSFGQVRIDAAKSGNEFDLVDFILSTVKSKFGNSCPETIAARESVTKHDKYKDHLSTFKIRIEDLVKFMNKASAFLV